MQACDKLLREDSAVTVNRHLDGSAGDANYGAIGTVVIPLTGNPSQRLPSSSKELWVEGKNSSECRGWGRSSYEPTDRQVTAVEPSASMRAAEDPPHLSQALDAVAGKSFSLQQTEVSDASMASFSSFINGQIWELVWPRCGESPVGRC